jgi:Cdc6-like AAA superfamily ATPase
VPVAFTFTGRMTYRLRDDQPDPMSRQALLRVRRWDQRNPEDILMRSSSMTRLSNYLERYCRGDIDGFSVLIAGQRGAGKTTLAKLLIQNAIQNTNGLIPLPIFLHGPTIIDPEANTDEKDEEKEDPIPIVTGAVVNIGNNRVGPRPVAQTPTSEPDDYLRARKAKETALPKLISSLYRHFSDAMCDAWRNAACHSVHSRRPMREALELAAHLDRLLELAPGVEPLRRMWARAGFLHNGVAFYLRKPADLHRNRLFRHLAAPPIAGNSHDQGLREIVALAACADAFRGVVGKKSTETWRSSQTSEHRRRQGLPPLTESEEKKKEDKEKKDKERKEAAGKVGPPVLGIAASGVAAVVASAATNRPQAWLLAGLLGVIVWTASWFVLNYGVRRESKLGLERESTTEIDWTTVRVLERRFPALIRRVKDAGFAPIFVLDELDKVADAMEKLDDFLRLTKHIVTDEAAFFFLVNRDYYERVERLDREPRSDRPRQLRA